MDCTIYVAKTKVLISCAFVFAYAKSRFSHDVAHIKLLLVNKVSGCVDLTQGQFEMVFIVQHIDKVSIEWMYILNKRTTKVSKFTVCW